MEAPGYLGMRLGNLPLILFFFLKFTQEKKLFRAVDTVVDYKQYTFVFRVISYTQFRGDKEPSSHRMMFI